MGVVLPSAGLQHVGPRSTCSLDMRVDRFVPPGLMPLDMITGHGGLSVPTLQVTMCLPSPLCIHGVDVTITSAGPQCTLTLMFCMRV